MIHFDITPGLREKKITTIRRKFNATLGIFITVCFLPFVLYTLYASNVFQSMEVDELAELEKATAMVFVNLPNGQAATGSTFLISDTKLLTARHVIAGLSIGDKVELSFTKTIPGKETTATIEWIANSAAQENDLDYFLTDVALLRLDDLGLVEELSLVPISIGNSDGLGNLTPVIAIGYPGGDYSIKRGDINSDQVQELDLFKVDPSANPGDSGGPLILEKDQTAIGMMVGGVVRAEGENVAIKINSIIKLLESAGITIE